MLRFEVMRHQYEKRLKKLEQQVLECTVQLEQERQQREQKLISYMPTDKYLSWKFEMNEFPLQCIKIELRQRRVLLHARRKQQDQYLEVYRQFRLPDNAGDQLSAKLDNSGTLTIRAPLRIRAD